MAPKEDVKKFCNGIVGIKNVNSKNGSDRARSIWDSSDLPDDMSISSDKRVAQKKYSPVSYEAFMVVWFILLCIITSAEDRFIWNACWPRQTWTIGAGSAGSDRMEGYKPGPWSVVLYDILARVSGRFSIVAYNYLLLTRLESLESWISSSFVAKYLLDCSNIVRANLRMHTWTGILLCIMTLLHVWSILFPCIFHGYSAKMIPGNFEWPVSERTPPKCADMENPPYDGSCWPGDANPFTKTMGLQADDVFRMVEMTIFLAVLMPLSIHWLASHWHGAIHLHRFIHVIYFVDIVRRHSHPHSWILNTPMFFLFYLDKWVWGYFVRRQTGSLVRRVKLSEDYMVILWKSRYGTRDTVGPEHFLHLRNSSMFEDKHAFTCFQNISGQSLLYSITDETPWTFGVVVRIFRNKRFPVIGERVSQTWRMYDEHNLKDNLVFVGPRQGELSELLRKALLQDEPLVVVGAGSAVNYLLDCLQWCTANEPVCEQIKLVFSTRDFDLYCWVKNAIEQLKEKLQVDVFDIQMAFTGESLECSDMEMSTNHWFDAVAEDSAKNGVQALIQRANLEEVANGSSIIFCQGSQALKEAVAEACSVVGGRFRGGRGGS